MKIYLASPFFNEKELENVKLAESILTNRGFDLFSPRLNEIREQDCISTRQWSEQTFYNDKINIGNCDVVVMLYYGAYSDSGTAWECGYAYGIGKPVVVVQLGDSSNLMVHEGCRTNISLDELKEYDFTNLPIKSYNGKML